MRNSSWKRILAQLFARPRSRRQVVKRLVLESLQSRVVFDANDDPTVSPELNSGNSSAAFASTDVNRDGLVTPLDALQIINWISANSPRLDHTNPAFASSFDVNQDQEISGVDATLVINFLAANDPQSFFSSPAISTAFSNGSGSGSELVLSQC